MKQWGQSNVDSLPSSVIDTLLSELGLDKFLNNPSCKLSDSMFTENVVETGWTSGN